ncbi:MAG: outer membrane protein assembly factor BamA [Dysgonamonadaceae bacterium]|jgi:outer membrane protein insertion porin family|nr:outer membrane protein assembly factor BamA [Dysgonamonadaceae bacterium]
MYRKLLLFCLWAFAIQPLSAQDTFPAASSSEPELPVISYSLNNNKKHTIADIKVTGVENYGYEDYVLVGISGLSVGQKVSVPGDELTAAVKAFWKHGLFSDAAIYASRLTADSVWINIALKPNPVISTINYHGVKKSEQEDLEGKIGMAKGSQLTPNLINRARKRIKDYFDEKGFSNAEIIIRQYDDVANRGKSIMDVTINKNEKTKVREIYITGNEKVSYYDLRMAMKKTNSGFSLKKNRWLNIRKLFSTKKFVREEYEKDLQNIIAKYNEKGFRDAEIIVDSVVMVDDKHVSVHIDVKEGDQYFIRDIKWVGNTQYPSNYLELILNMNPGDVYNQKKLGERLQSDEDAVANIYYNNGYIFARMNPVETYVENDSVDLEIRVVEGRPATINRVIISGNDRIYEDVVRRELLTKPGQLFSKDLLIRSAREIAQSGHFDPENMDINPLPNEETGTVDIQYGLTPKANDQIEFSAGYGPTGIIGRMSLKFSNFSMKNLLYPSTYKGIIPQGDGQTLTLSGQTNGRYYQSYSISFLDPWFGKKRPNSFSLSAYYMITTGVEDRYYQQLASTPYYYGQLGSGYNDYSGVAYDENRSLKIFGLSAGYGKRLSWPDYLFNFMADLSYQRYMLKNWQYYNNFPITDGNSNSLSLGLTLSRSSIDNPLYTRKGSQFTASLNVTPPYSLLAGKVDETKIHEWVEFHKWKFKSKIFIPLANPETVKRTPVLMSRIEYGFIGSYNDKKRTPFETFQMGGDGMTGYSSTIAIETIGLRGYGNGMISYNEAGYAYSRLALELRYPILLEPTSTIYALAFVEAGNAWGRISSFNPFDLKRSAGVGARIFLPMIGLMGIDWGYGFDRPYPGAAISGGQLHFILGQEF